MKQYTTRLNSNISIWDPTDEKQWTDLYNFSVRDLQWFRFLLIFQSRLTRIKLWKCTCEKYTWIYDSRWLCTSNSSLIVGAPYYLNAMRHASTHRTRRSVLRFWYGISFLPSSSSLTDKSVCLEFQDKIDYHEKLKNEENVLKRGNETWKTVSLGSMEAKWH